MYRRARHRPEVGERLDSGALGADATTLEVLERLASTLRTSAGSGAVVAHSLWVAEVVGSNPISPTQAIAITLRRMPSGDRRVALVQNAGGYCGPVLCRILAESRHDLVVYEPRDGLVEQLEGLGASVEVVGRDSVPSGGPGSLTTAEGWQTLVERAVGRFGRLDAAAVSPPAGGARVPRGPFLESTVDQLQGMYGYFDATYFALGALIPQMKGQEGGGQILVFTSDAGARPEAGWSLYGAVRAGQSFLVRAIALEHARDGININAIGSKNAIMEGFPFTPPGAATDDAIVLGEWAEPLLAETPLPWLGTMEQLGAFASILLDGRNRFQTAQYFSYSGGWSTGGT